MAKYTLLATISLPKFPTHLPKTNNVKVPNKMWKVNGNAIYSKALNEFARAVVVKNAHDYIVNKIKEQKLDNLKLNGSMVIVYEITTVYNHSTISLRNGNLTWKPPAKMYDPNWDIENLASFWTKVGNDSLTIAGVIIDDNVRFIKGTSHIFHECNHIDERLMQIKIYEYTKS